MQLMDGKYRMLNQIRRSVENPYMSHTVTIHYRSYNLPQQGYTENFA